MPNTSTSRNASILVVLNPCTCFEFCVLCHLSAPDICVFLQDTTAFRVGCVMLAAAAVVAIWCATQRVTLQHSSSAADVNSSGAGAVDLLCNADDGSTKASDRTFKDDCIILRQAISRMGTIES